MIRPHTPESAHELAARVARDARHLIGGELVPGAVSATVAAPWDLSRSVTYLAVDNSGAQAAIRAAAHAFATDERSPERHRDVLRAMADRAEEIQEDLAALIAFENGKLMPSATMEAAAVAGSLRYWAEVHPQNETLSSGDDHVTELIRRPLGVIAAITPFNMPVLMAVNKIGAAIATGNTVVCKPSPATPLSALLFARAVADVVPAGWVNIFAGTDETGPFLSTSPDVALVSFTGSIPVGKQIMASASQELTRVQLELGGNDPAIIGPGADLDTVVPQIFRSAFGSSGQACVAAKRVYAPADLADEVADRLATLAQATRVGHPFDPEATAPVLTTRAQYEKVDAMLNEARTDAQVVFEGVRDSETGYYVHPSIVTGATNGMAIVDEEQFGPVLPVVSYATTSEVVALANATPFGLGASVWSPDDEFLTAVVPRLEAGTVWVNGLGRPSPDLPFGGVKQSGIGREGGAPGIDDFSELVTITRFRPTEAV